MVESFRALVSDFYLNQKLSLKLDLPKDRQTILDLFDRVRRERPAMDQFRRYRDELALESNSSEPQHQWLAIRSSSVRAGAVNPDSLDEAYQFHRHILEIIPYFLSISPLDIECIEALYGFDLVAAGNHDQVVYDALVSDSPLGRLVDIPGAVPIDVQPILGVALRDPAGIEAHFEVKTRSQGRKNSEHGEPISVYLTLRKYGPVTDVKDLTSVLQQLADRGEELIESRVLPGIVVPLREAIGFTTG